MTSSTINTAIKLIFMIIIGIIGGIVMLSTMQARFPIGKMVLSAMGGAVQGYFVGG